MDPAWSVTKVGNGTTPIVIHVPHAGTWIPDSVRGDLLLDGPGLRDELARMTDWYTDRLAVEALTTAGIASTVFANRASRLVIDPERFVGDGEPMEAIEMGPVYQVTSDLRPLRTPDPARDRQLLDLWFHPYAAAFTDQVDSVLARLQRVTIVDLHSYPRLPLPYETDPYASRPAVCLGTDPFHTPNALHAVATETLSGTGRRIENNTPFAGTYVPLKHLDRTAEVSSIMVEIRRDQYQVEPGGPPNEDWRDVVHTLAAFLEQAADITD